MVDYNTETITPFPPLPTAWDEYFPNIRIGYPAHLAQAEDESHIERRGKTSIRVLRVHLSPARTPRVTQFSGPPLTLAALTCSSGATSLYKYPAARDVVNATDPVNFQWDTSCKVGSVEKIDLYLYMPSAENALLHAWSGIPFADGQYAAQLSPYWWNLTKTADLYVNIMKHQGQVWENTWSRGPSFSVIWEPSMTSTLSLPTGTGVVQAVDGNVSGKKVSKGVIAVAVIIPIVVIAIAGGVAYWFFRVREKEKLKRWSQALSQHSAMEWEKGALPGERLSAYGRPSSSYQRSRPSTGYGRPSTGYGRPSSSVMLDNMAGAGAYGNARFPGNSTENLDADGNIRSSVIMPDGYVRQSRISFADQARPRLSSSNDASRPHISSGLHTAAVYNSGSAIDDEEVSPTQVDGPSPFGDSEMLTAGQNHTGLVDRKLSPAYKTADLPAVPPAAAMRTDSDDLRNMPALQYATSADDFSAPPPQLEDPSRSLSPDANSSAHGHSTVQYGPDQMLAVYAARGKASSPEPSNPPPVAKSGIRRLLTRKESGRASGRATPTGRQTPSGRQTPAGDARGESPEPVSMRSYVHLNNGTASSQVVDALPPPGPPGRSQSQQGHGSQLGHE